MLPAGAQLHGGAWPELAVRPLQGLVWVGVWCKRTTATRVIHWAFVMGSGMAGAWGSAVEAARRGGARRSARVLATGAVYGPKV